MKKVLIGVLVVFGILFLVLLLMPDDDVSTTEKPRTEAEVGAPAGKASKSGVEMVSVGKDADSATIMIYVNGSDLESNSGEATEDITEMLSSGIGDHVNVIMQTMGTRKWDRKYGISSDHAQTWQIRDGKLQLLRDDLDQLDCTAEDTLSEFIGYCKDSYPADRYLFIFWDHGGGPVYGFGYDEWQDEEDSLTIAEMSRAFAKHPEIRFDIIGMDCCIMSNIETCYALAPYCRYALLSEDFESGIGWNYTGWMKDLEEKPGISTPLLGKNIVDSFVDANETDTRGSSGCLTLVNMSTVKNLFTAWKAYAYKNEDALLDKNYSRKHEARGRGNKGFWELWSFDNSNVTLSDYYISDILALTESIDNSSDEAKSLMSALKAANAYFGHTSDKNELTGLSVSLPYGDSEFYEHLRSVYTDIDLDEDYIDWLGQFVEDDNYDDFFDFGFFESLWNGWASYESEYGCNISGGGSCEYGYDYDTGDYYGDDEEECCDDWIYDYEEDIWYLYDGDTLYLYDEESDLLCFYDEEEDEIYFYDEDADDWFLMEDE